MVFKKVETQIVEWVLYMARGWEPLSVVTVDIGRSYVPPQVLLKLGHLANSAISCYGKWPLVCTTNSRFSFINSLDLLWNLPWGHAFATRSAGKLVSHREQSLINVILEPNDKISLFLHLESIFRNYMASKMKFPSCILC